jgi:hypothetical protein
MPPLSHLTSCTPSKSNLYLTNYLSAAVFKPALHRFLTFQVPNLMSFFRRLGRTRALVQVRESCNQFVTRWEVISTSPNPQAGGSPLVACPTTAYSIYSQQPSILEAVPPSATWGRAMCRGDRDPLTTGVTSMRQNCYPLTSLSKATWRKGGHYCATRNLFYKLTLPNAICVKTLLCASAACTPVQHLTKKKNLFAFRPY